MTGHISSPPLPLPGLGRRWFAATPAVAVLARRLALPLLLLGSFALRLQLLAAYPFREDEAMYSVWALHLWRVDPLALTLWPDKPPLYLWLLGAFFQLFGPSEVAARLLNIAADTVTVALVIAIGSALWGRRAGLAAGIAYALSPYAISFAPTAYTDPTLVLWGTAALYAAITGRGFWAGFFLAAAIATKQQGLLYAPLVAGLIFQARRSTDDTDFHSFNPRKSALSASSAFYPAFVGLLLLLLPVLLWDASRWSVAPSPWDLSVRNYAPLALLSPEQWRARLVDWAALAWHGVKSWWVAGYWVLGIGYWRLGSRVGDGDGPRRFFRWMNEPGILCALWAGGFLALHIVTSVQVWDRYLLPLAPLLALALGWSASRLGADRPRGWLAVLLLALLMLPPGLAAARGDLPLGGDHGDYAGLGESIDWLRENAPPDAIVYHREVGWQLRFAFFAGRPERPDATRFELRWFPNAVYLADNAAKSPAQHKFLVAPIWGDNPEAGRMQQRGLDLQARFSADNFVVYEIAGPAARPCDWCVCAPPGARGFLADQPRFSGVQP